MKYNTVQKKTSASNEEKYLEEKAPGIVLENIRTFRNVPNKNNPKVFDQVSLMKVALPGKKPMYSVSRLYGDTNRTTEKYRGLDLPIAQHVLFREVGREEEYLTYRINEISKVYSKKDSIANKLVDVILRKKK